MVIAHPNEDKDLRETVRIRRKPRPSEEEKRIFRYIDQLNETGYVIDTMGRFLEVSMIAGNEVHLVQVDKFGNPIDTNSKAYNKTIDIRDMIDVYIPYELMRNNRDTVRAPKVSSLRENESTTKLTKDLKKPVLPYRGTRNTDTYRKPSKGRIETVKVPAIKKVEDEALITGSYRKPTQGHTDTVKIPASKEAENDSFLTQTPFAKTPEQRNQVIKKRQTNTAKKRSESETRVA